METTSNAVKSIHRALKIIEILALTDEEELGIAQLSEEIGLPKSTTHRILSTLVREGYVEQDRRTKRYKLTLKLMQLGGMVQRRVRLLTQIRPYLCRLTQLTRESTALAVVTQHKEVIIVDQVNFPDEISPMPTLGLEKPLHCTAAGKALLAALPEEEAREALKGRELVRYTEKTISSLPALVRQLRAFRSQGYAQEDEEYELGVRGVASAIRKRGGDVVAIIEIRAPSVRLTRERLSELGKYVRLAAREISLGLGYKPCAQD